MFNQFTGIGRLATDPESRFTQSGKQVVNFTLCCDSGWGDNKRTEFVKVVAWDKLAETISSYLHKGSPCMIQGEMQTRKWQDNEGKDRYTTEIIARNLTLLPSGGKQHQGTDDNNDYNKRAIGNTDVPF